MKIRSILLVGVTATMAVFIMCASFEQFIQPPQIKVESIDITDFSFTDITLDFTMLVNNPNVFAVDLDGYAYQFSIDGKEMVSADEARPLNIAGAGQSAIKLPVTVNFKKVYELIKESRDSDSLSYSLKGNLTPGGILSAFNLPFQHSGRLPNIRVPNLSLANVRIKKIGLSGIDLETRLNISNNNVFSFDVGKLNYELGLGGHSVARGTMPDVASIPAKGKGEVLIPLSLDLGGALASIRSLLNGNQILTSINGDAQLGTPFGPITLPFNTTGEIPLLK